MVYTIWFWVDLIRFGKDSYVCSCIFGPGEIEKFSVAQGDFFINLQNQRRNFQLLALSSVSNRKEYDCNDNFILIVSQLEFRLVHNHAFEIVRRLYPFNETKIYFYDWCQYESGSNILNVANFYSYSCTWNKMKENRTSLSFNLSTLQQIKTILWCSISETKLIKSLQSYLSF